MGSIYKRKWKAPDAPLAKAPSGGSSTTETGNRFEKAPKAQKFPQRVTCCGTVKVLRDREGIKGVSIGQRFNRIMLDEPLTDLETEYQVNGRDTLMDLKGRLRPHIRTIFRRNARGGGHHVRCCQIHVEASG